MMTLLAVVGGRVVFLSAETAMSQAMMQELVGW
jgi:hypothetical protein